MKRIAAILVAMMTIAAHATPQTTTGSLQFVGNVWPSGVSSDPDYLTYWNQVTVENGGKWGNVEHDRGVMHWEDADNAYRFAQKNRLPFRYHNLVWGEAQPPWIYGMPSAEALTEVERWIRQVGGRYPDTAMVDVVNEPFHAKPPYIDALGGAGETRWDWVINAFRLARTYLPRAELGLNEYGILPYADATSAYLKIVRLLKERNLIDYIGLQCHGLENVPPETIAANLKLVAAEMLPIYVTELDIAIEDDSLQAGKMQALMTVFSANPEVRGVTFWGYKEAYIYSRRAMLLRADGTERPALAWLRDFTARLR